MKILVIGCNGQIGTELMRHGFLHHDMIGMTHQILDITDPGQVLSTIMKAKPDIVINVAAYTAVDKAELEPDICYAVNRDGAKNLADACSLGGVPFIHISTDYVFNGSKSSAYVEDDPVSPLGVYGKSKTEGEVLVRECCVKHIILRTSWVFSAQGNNFLKTMLRLGADREKLEIVSDQHGCPTSASDIASTILRLCEHHDEQWGTYHFCQPERTTWYEFARAIFASARRHGMKFKIRDIKAVETKDYPTYAKRPANSELYCGKLMATFGIIIRPWQDAVVEVIEELDSV